MKRVLLGILAGTMVLFVSVPGVLATWQGAGRNFADAERDGICDYAGTACRYADADGDGVCDWQSAHRGGCEACFVDDNGDGACDNNPGRGLGLGRGFRGGRGK